MGGGVHYMRESTVIAISLSVHLPLAIEQTLTHYDIYQKGRTSKAASDRMMAFDYSLFCCVRMARGKLGDMCGILPAKILGVT